MPHEPHLAITQMDPAAYEDLVERRRTFGLAKFGDRHLTRTDLLTVCQGEIADALVYLRLENQRRKITTVGYEGVRDLYRQCEQQTLKLGHALNLVAAGTSTPTPPFLTQFEERWQFGADTYGPAYLDRENLPQALEELADFEVFLALERDRLEHDGDDRASLALHGFGTHASALAYRILGLQYRVDDLAPIRPTSPAPTGHMAAARP